MITDQLVHSPARRRSTVQPEDAMAHRIAIAFVFYGLLAVVFLAINMPPFQNPDELAHLLRAAQLADGALVGTRIKVTGPDGRQYLQGGGQSDRALLTAYAPFSPLIGQPGVKATRQDWAPQVHWSDVRIQGAFPNTAIYPPFFYIPSALGVLAGRMTRATVVQSLTVARLLTGVTAVAVGAVAIACAGGGAIWIFAIMTLPMSLALLASPAADALLLAFSALAAALMVRLLWRPALPNRGILAWLALALGLVAMARPPYGSLILLLFALGQVTWRLRIVAAVAVVLCILSWSGITAITTLSNPGVVVHADPAQQIRSLWADPLQILPLAGATLKLYWHGYLIGFVGQLGWLDTELPSPYRRAALLMLAVAAIAAALGFKGQPVRAASRLLVAGAILIGAAGVFLIEYLTWTVPGSPVIEGVQGRYFLPLALPVAALLPALGGTRFGRLHHALVLAVVAFPVITLGVVMRAVVLRYYLG
jgi:uncharacterized membrane protein